MLKKAMPLEGIRVIELSSYLAVPGCGRILAHLGADVIKVEKPGGDPWRKMGELYEIPCTDETNPLFVVANSGKRFLSVDLKTASGMEIFIKLINTADVFITNFMDSSLRKLHVTYEELSGIRPSLVYGRVVGYGEKGEDANRPGFDATAYYARGGLMLDYVQKGAPPNNFMYGGGDAITALSLTAGVLAGLAGVQLHGEGCSICASLLHSAIWTASMNYIISQYDENYHIDRVYRCKDDAYVFVQAVTEKQKLALCDIIGITPEEYDDRRKIIPRLREIYSQKTFNEWSELFAHTNICIERLRHLREVPFDEQALCNRFLVPYCGNQEKAVHLSMPPIQFEGAPDYVSDEFRTGKDTRQILYELGYSSETIERLSSDKVISI
jgi:crotonobetainyl-CoA:carnitine CoA-transferase CaiB-like acyl-CoA transferase